MGGGNSGHGQVSRCYRTGSIYSEYDANIIMGDFMRATLVLLAGLVSTSAFAGTPAPIVGGSVPGMVMLAVAGVGYLAVRGWKRRR
jgi:hypothetical protein